MRLVPHRHGDRPHRRLACPQIVRVPGNDDARNVGYLGFEDTFGARDSGLRLELGGREHYG